VNKEIRDLPASRVSRVSKELLASLEFPEKMEKMEMTVLKERLESQERLENPEIWFPESKEPRDKQALAERPVRPVMSEPPE